jgi:hypothetical protein
MTEIEYETDSRDESRIDTLEGVKVDGDDVKPTLDKTIREMDKVTDARVVDVEAWDELQDAVDAGEVEVDVTNGALVVEEV